MEFVRKVQYIRLLFLGMQCSCSILSSDPLGGRRRDLWVSSCFFFCVLTYGRCLILTVLNQGKVVLFDKWLLAQKCHLSIRFDIETRNAHVFGTVVRLYEWDFRCKVSFLNMNICILNTVFHPWTIRCSLCFLGLWRFCLIIWTPI